MKGKIDGNMDVSMKIINLQPLLKRLIYALLQTRWLYVQPAHGVEPQLHCS